jgi:hypothetical protein
VSFCSWNYMTESWATTSVKSTNRLSQTFVSFVGSVVGIHEQQRKKNMFTVYGTNDRHNILTNSRGIFPFLFAQFPISLFGECVKQFNPLITNRRLLYLKTQFVQRRLLYLKTQFVQRRLLYIKTQFVPRRLLFLKTQFIRRRLLYLKTQFVPHGLLYLKTQFVPRSKHFSSRLQKPISLWYKWHKSLFVLR